LKAQGTSSGTIATKTGIPKTWLHRYPPPLPPTTTVNNPELTDRALLAPARSSTEIANQIRTIRRRSVRSNCPLRGHRTNLVTPSTGRDNASTAAIRPCDTQTAAGRSRSG
jgi:hypothetical protein